MPPTIGQHLRRAREERYISLEKAAEETRIRTAFIRALEADDYSLMPSAAQGRGFLRNYADYLGIDIDEVIAELQRHAPPAALDGPLERVNPVETEVPPLTGPEADRKPARFWTTWRARLRKPAAVPLEEPAGIEGAAAPAPVESAEGAPQDETPPPAAEAEAPLPNPQELQTESEPAERPPGLLQGLRAFFRVRMSPREAAPQAETPPPPVLEAAPAPPQPVESAAQIFVEIGRRLRERRELISLTVDEVERHTHLRAALVRALEEGAPDRLPSPVQTRGMLANYAAFLDLDADAILLRFADALQARHREKYASTPRERIETEVVTSMPPLRTFVAGDLVFGVGMVVLIVALGVWGIGRVLSSREQAAEPQATAPSIVDVLAGTAQPTPSVDATFIPVDEAPLATLGAESGTLAAPTPGANINVVIGLFAVERTFVRVSVDGETAFQGRLAPGETRSFEAENQVEVLTGNGAALRVTYNGRDLGLMGNVGQVVSHVYTLAGIVTPTATVPPTPTATSPATVTSTATSTATPTATPTPVTPGPEAEISE